MQRTSKIPPNRSLTACYSLQAIDTVLYFTADALSATDYYPFGMQMVGKSFIGVNYKYGFNGKEIDNELSGNGNQYDYGFRIYNPRVGKFLSVDPLTKDYPWYTPYQFAGNKPIWAVDLDGLEEYYATDGTYIGNVGSNTEVRIINDSYLHLAIIAIEKANSHDEKTEYGYGQALIDQSTSFVDYATNENDVLNNAPLEAYSTHGDCKVAADAQMSKAGQSTKNKYHAIHTDVNNSVQPPGNQLTGNTVGGAIYIMTQLKAGNPVLVGVKMERSSDGTTVDRNNHNRNTGHFLVISSMHVNNGRITFGYYDNANRQTGKSNDNRFDVDNSSGVMHDNTNLGVGGVQSYQVSEVRKNEIK